MSRKRPDLLMIDTAFNQGHLIPQTLVILNGEFDIADGRQVLRLCQWSHPGCGCYAYVYTSVQHVKNERCTKNEACPHPRDEISIPLVSEPRSSPLPIAITAELGR